MSDVFQKYLAIGLHTTLAWWPTDQVIASKDQSWKFHELSVRQLQCLPTVKSSNEIGTLLVLKYKYWLSFANQIFIQKIQKWKPTKNFMELASNYYACHICPVVNQLNSPQGIIWSRDIFHMFILTPRIRDSSCCSCSCSVTEKSTANTLSNG